MNQENQQNAVYNYKEVKRPSPMPYLVAGVAFLLYGIFSPILTVMNYIVGFAIAAGAFVVARLIWKDRIEKVELPPNTGDTNTDQLLAEARGELVAIRSANDRIADPKISATIDNIESTCMQILSRLKEAPDLYSQLRTFLRYYLPTTRKLLDSRASIEQEKNGGENAQQVVARTDRVLPEIEKAFNKQLEALDKHKYLDIQVEMDVLEGMLKSDGLSENENTSQGSQS